jgi:glycerol kinase
MTTGSKPYKPEKGLLTSIAWDLQGKVDYLLEGSVFNAGVVFQWLRDELGLLQNATESDVLSGFHDNQEFILGAPVLSFNFTARNRQSLFSSLVPSLI